ncbi:MAG: prephenate dehydratase [Lachnospiraceae bacterium]|nr:prephenate dehydratase [Lachnospiraceae bacterium]
MELSELRKQLDAVDDELQSLYLKRMEICRDVAAYKTEKSGRVYDRDREMEKIRSYASAGQDDLTRAGLSEMAQLLMSNSRELQYGIFTEKGMLSPLSFTETDGIRKKGLKTVFQGDRGAYSHEALKKYFGEDTDCFHVKNFRDVMDALQEGSADYGILPIENTTAGIVAQTYDLLASYDLYIVSEVVIPIRHCLMAVPGTKLEDITDIYSHPQSLMQSAAFLDSHPKWSRHEMLNNAFAAQKVKDDKDPTQAAIAGKGAAGEYGLEILVEGVNQEEKNETRFVVISGRREFVKGARKISLCLEIPHTSGSLYHILSHFMYNSLNLTNIECRPIPDRNWEYRFFIDFEGALSDPAVRTALTGVREEARGMKILGCY